MSSGLSSGNADDTDLSVATGTHDAIVRLQTNTADGRAGSALELIVQSTMVNEEESLLLNVYYMALPQGQAESRVPDTASDHERYLAGTVAFFPPPRVDETRRFVVDGPSDPSQQWQVVVELVSALSGRAVVDSSVRVISASTIAK